MFPPGKTAEPDGFRSEFYKRSRGIRALLLFRMMNEFILRERKFCLVYCRPIALQNCDIKVITEALAFRLNKHLSSIIHPDQTGFIPTRFPLHRSLQQGFLLSPARIATAIEPLALSIRDHSDVRGLEVGSRKTLIR